MATRNVLAFALAATDYGLDARHLRHVQRWMGPVLPLSSGPTPEPSAWLDLRMYLGLESLQSRERSRQDAVIVVQVDPFPVVGLLVDRVHDLFAVEHTSWPPAPPELEWLPPIDLICGAGHTQRGRILLLNTELLCEAACALAAGERRPAATPTTIQYT